jgi:hypothetical protein
MWKDCKVVMLPTNEKAMQKGQIYLHEDIIRISNLDIEVKNKLVKPQHLYILSDDEIKKYDFVYNPIYKTIYQWIENADIKFDKINAKKIIATTNPLLNKELGYFTFNVNCWDERTVMQTERGSLPKPTKDFIHKFCEMNGIWDVQVVYEMLPYSNILQPNSIEVQPIFITRVNDDNTINIA